MLYSRSDQVIYKLWVMVWDINDFYSSGCCGFLSETESYKTCGSFLYVSVMVFFIQMNVIDCCGPNTTNIFHLTFNAHDCGLISCSPASLDILNILNCVTYVKYYCTLSLLQPA